MTVANTGRLTEMSESHIGRCSCTCLLLRPCRCLTARARRPQAGRGGVADLLLVAVEAHAGAVAKLDDALGHHEVALREPCRDFNDAVTALADLNFVLTRDAVRSD